MHNCFPKPVNYLHWGFDACCAQGMLQRAPVWEQGRKNTLRANIRDTEQQMKTSMVCPARGVLRCHTWTPRESVFVDRGVTRVTMDAFPVHDRCHTWTWTGKASFCELAIFATAFVVVVVARRRNYVITSEDTPPFLLNRYVEMNLLNALHMLPWTQRASAWENVGDM